MKPEEIRTIFEKLAATLGYTVRYEKGDFRGGACRINDDKQIIINSAAPIRHQNFAFARVLVNLNPLFDGTDLPAEAANILKDISEDNKRRAATDTYALD